MSTLLIFAWTWLAMIAMSIWESHIEGRNAWDKGKIGWKIRFTRHLSFTVYHFFVLVVMLPLLMTLPLVISGWDTRLFGILLSAYISGLIIEDFGWYVFNPVVKLKEFWSSFSDYYPWLRIGKKKIIPWFYIIGVLITILSWYFLWK